MAPQRQKRPKLSQDPNAGACPFCPGAEQETPPEVDAVRVNGSASNGPGWRVRAFPNKYPGNAHHEVVVEGDRHCQQPGELDESYWVDVITIWQRRIRAIEQRPDVGCAFLLKNVGAPAGASIVHNHSQLIGLPELPPRLQVEQACAAARDQCPWCAALATAQDEGRLILQAPAHAVLTPIVPRLPCETWLLPLDCNDDFLTTDVASLGHALHRLFVAIQQGLGSAPFNLWLHRIPAGNFHWHFEMQPRSGQPAGLELGGDMYINSVLPAQAAARLRDALK
jgi:UDPglucose--hexose-1-phosphate uridylyltransferase